MATRTKKISLIPKFNSPDEEATYWDEHTATEFEAELKEVDLRVSASLEHVIEIALDRESMGRLSDASAREGINVIALAHRWLLERLALEEKRSRKHPNSAT